MPFSCYVAPVAPGLYATNRGTNAGVTLREIAPRRPKSGSTPRLYLSREWAMRPASVTRKLQALRRFCRWAHAIGKLRTNVAAELKLARALRVHTTEDL